MTFDARPLTPETWPDLEELFGRKGGSIVRGCWCMYYRRTGRVEVSVAAGEGNKQQLHCLVDDGVVPGLLGYLDGVPIGWISLGPRADYLKLARSRVMKPVDDAEVWSIVCTFTDKAHRGRGVQRKMLRAGIGYARSRGVRLLESYPVDKDERSHDDFLFFGSRSLYEKEGFREVARRSPTRVVMRRALRPRRPPETQPSRGAGAP